MKRILQDQLYAKYPKIFANKDRSMKESCLYFGLECGDGWYDILDHLCAALSNVYSTGFYIGDEYVSVNPPQVVADQVKEKMSSLRFYYHLEFSETILEAVKTNPASGAHDIMRRYYDYIGGIVHMAESMSERICEDTGKEGELHVSGGSRYGWYRTLNREHAKTDPFCVSREYVPVADLPKEEEVSPQETKPTKEAQP